MEMETIATETEKKFDESPGTSKALPKVANEGEEDAIYTKLQSPSEDLYAETTRAQWKKTGSPSLQDVRLWKAVSACLGVTCLLLLLFVITLVVKRPPSTQDAKANSAPCFYKSESQSSGCGAKWLRHGQSCFFLSTFRQNWDGAQQHCVKQGGRLAVINSSAVQDFLTQKGNLMYWIGLKHNNNFNSDTWTWVDNSNLDSGYWSESQLDGNCVFLKSTAPSQKNWIKSPCSRHTYYICERPNN